ncbi:hypothetical protein HYX13_00370 [Candidatus Woesearchaeota archaeon]|nr:hypothetical protein [Candidatus Woesearchaeota archaeon]
MTADHHKSLESLEIVVVDDEKDSLDMLSLILQSRGYPVTAFRNPVDAATYISLHPSVALLVTDYIFAGQEIDGAREITIKTRREVKLYWHGVYGTLALSPEA